MTDPATDPAETVRALEAAAAEGDVAEVDRLADALGSVPLPAELSGRVLAALMRADEQAAG